MSLVLSVGDLSDYGVKVLHNAELREYVCVPYSQGRALGEEAYYYTDDRSDAVSTAYAMVKAYKDAMGV